MGWILYSGLGLLVLLGVLLVILAIVGTPCRNRTPQRSSI